MSTRNLGQYANLVRTFQIDHNDILSGMECVQPCVQNDILKIFGKHVEMYGTVPSSREAWSKVVKQ